MTLRTSHSWCWATKSMRTTARADRYPGGHVLGGGGIYEWMRTVRGGEQSCVQAHPPLTMQVELQPLWHARHKHSDVYPCVLHIPPSLPCACAPSRCQKRRRRRGAVQRATPPTMRRQQRMTSTSSQLSAALHDTHSETNRRRSSEYHTHYLTGAQCHRGMSLRNVSGCCLEVCCAMRQQARGGCSL